MLFCFGGFLSSFFFFFFLINHTVSLKEDDQLFAAAIFCLISFSTKNTYFLYTFDNPKKKRGKLALNSLGRDVMEEVEKKIAIRYVWNKAMHVKLLP